MSENMHEQPHNPNPLSYSLAESKEILRKDRPYDNGDKLVLDFMFTAGRAIDQELGKKSDLDDIEVRRRVFQVVREKYNSLTREEKDAVEVALESYDRALSPTDVYAGPAGSEVHDELEQAFAERFQTDWHALNPRDQLIFLILFSVTKDDVLDKFPELKRALGEYGAL